MDSGGGAAHAPEKVSSFSVDPASGLSDFHGRRVAFALGLEGAGTLLTLRFRLLNETGSAVSITSGIVTRVDADYNQTKSYVAIQDGGIAAGTAPLPAPAVTPWVPATPVPTPSPTPEVTATPEASATPEEIAATPAATDAPAEGLSTNVFYIGGGLLLIIVLLVVILFVRKNKSR